MDLQYGGAVVVILLGLGIAASGGENEFYVGAGWGTLAIGCTWVFIRMYQAYKKR